MNKKVFITIVSLLGLVYLYKRKQNKLPKANFPKMIVEKDMEPSPKTKVEIEKKSQAVLKPGREMNAKPIGSAF